MVETLAQRTDELAILLSKAITQEVRPYPVPIDVVAQGCAANMRPVLSAIAAQGELDPRAAAQLGAERARDGVPLSSVMDVYRVGFRRFDRRSPRGGIPAGRNGRRPEPGPNELLVSGMAVGVCGTDREIGEGPLVKVPGAGLRCIRRWAVVIVTLARSMLSSNGDSASAPEDFAA